MSVSVWALLGAGVGFVISVAAGVTARGWLAARASAAGPDRSVASRGGLADGRRDLCCVLGGAAVFAGAGAHHPWMVLPLLPSLLVWAVAAYIDARTHIIPNQATRAAAAAAVLVVAAGTYVLGWHHGAAALLTAIGAGLLYLVMAIVPSGVGGGDLKLAPSIAAVTAMAAPAVAVNAIVVAFVATAAYGITTRTRTRGASTAMAPRIPHGPFMVLGAVLALAFS